MSTRRKELVIGIVMMLTLSVFAGCGEQNGKEETASGTSVSGDAVSADVIFPDNADYEESDASSLESLTVEAKDYYESSDKPDEEGRVIRGRWENSLCEYVWAYDSESDGQDEYVEQRNLKSGEVQQFDMERFRLWTMDGCTILGVSDEEMICVGSGINFVVYVVPLKNKNDKEEIWFHKKKIIYEENADYDYYDIKKYINNKGNRYYFLNTDGLLLMINGKKKKISYFEDEESEFYRVQKFCKTDDGGYAVIEPVNEDEDYREKRYTSGAIYVYRLGGTGKKRITDKIMPETISEVGGKKLYMTRVKGKDGKYDYGIYEYDFKKNKWKQFVSQKEIVNALPDKPSKNNDFMRALRYVGDTLYVETRYTGQCHVLSITADGEIALEEDVKELVRHREYNFGSSLEGADKKYTFANNKTIYLREEDGIVERTLEGRYVRTIHLPYDLLYINDDEMIVGGGTDYDEYTIYSIPLVTVDGVDFPDVSHIKKIVTESEGPFFHGDLYANKEYVIYFAEGYVFRLYDRKKKAFIKIKGIARADIHNNGTMMDCISGDRILFSSYPLKETEAEDEKCSLCYYRLGENKVRTIDTNCSYSTAYRFCEDGKKVVYGAWTQQSSGEARKMEYYIYNTDTEKTEELLSESDAAAINEKRYWGEDQSDQLFEWKDTLYLAQMDDATDTNFHLWSVNLSGEKTLVDENKLTDLIKRDMIGIVFGEHDDRVEVEKITDVTDGKIICGDYYYDIGTGERWASGGYGLFDRWENNGSEMSWVE